MKKIVTWKSETDTTGPCTIFHDPAQFGKSWEWGTTPKGVEKVPGWVTRTDAERLARKLNAEFKEV